MLNHKILTLMMVGIVLIALTGCSGAAAPAATEPPQSNTEPGSGTDLPVPSTGSGACTNPLFPVVEGATWTYSTSTTGGLNETFTHTNTITEVRDDGFTLTTEFEDITRTQEWGCRPEGLLALSLGGTSAGLTLQGVTAEFTTTDATGVTLPVEITAGMTWSNNLNLQGTITLPGDQSAEADGTLSFDFQEAGTESVIVPAGTFEATRVDLTSTFDIAATFQGTDVPVTLTGTGTIWYAPGVGLVKTTETGDMAGSTVSSTTELQSFNIP